MKWVRVHFKFLCAKIGLAGCLFSLSWEAVVWSTEHITIPSFAPLLSLPILASGLGILVVFCDLNIRQMALIKMLIGDERNFSVSYRQQLKRLLLWLVVFSPSIATICIQIIFLLISAQLSHMPEIAQNKLSVAVVTLIEFLSLLLCQCPFSIILILNALLAVIMEKENLSIFAGCKRMWLLSSYGWFFVLSAASLAAFIEWLLNCTSILYLMWEPVANSNLLGQLGGGLAKSIFWAGSTLVSGALAVIAIGLHAAVSFCIYQQLCMRIEGADIVERMKSECVR